MNGYREVRFLSHPLLLNERSSFQNVHDSNTWCWWACTPTNQWMHPNLGGIRGWMETNHSRNHCWIEDFIYTYVLDGNTEENEWLSDVEAITVDEDGELIDFDFRWWGDCEDYPDWLEERETNSWWFHSQMVSGGFDSLPDSCYSMRVVYFTQCFLLLKIT